VTLTQRIGSRLNAVFSVGYEHSTYQAYGSFIAIARTDDLLSAQFALNFDLGRRLNCSVTFTYDDNKSDVQSYRSMRVGLQATYTF
jgi:uncharacterized protein (PEP-CTERM system associated)